MLEERVPEGRGRVSRSMVVSHTPPSLRDISPSLGEDLFISNLFWIKCSRSAKQEQVLVCSHLIAFLDKMLTLDYDVMQKQVRRMAVMAAR